MLAAYPPSPSDRPISPSATLDATKVISICRAVEGYASIGAAMRSQGVSESRSDWRTMAEEGTDPFWAWALTCLDIAEGASIVQASSKLGGKIEEGDTSAIKFFLSKRDDAYKDVKKVEVSHTGSVNHVVQRKANDMLTKGRISIQELAAMQRKRMEDASPELLEERDAQGEPHELFRVRDVEKVLE